MPRRVRVLLLVILVELGLAAFYLYTADSPGTGPDSLRERGEIIAQTMGAVFGFGLLMFLLAWKNDKAEEARRRGE